MESNHIPPQTVPTVWIVGEYCHPEFDVATDLLHKTAGASSFADAAKAAATLHQGACAPDVIVLAEIRPGVMTRQSIGRLQRLAPLSGLVALLGSWCEGETRTGLPAAGVRRMFWYDFPQWWRRQLALHATGQCPDWVRPDDFGIQRSEIRNSTMPPSGLIVLDTTCRETANVLADVLHTFGFATVSLRFGNSALQFRGVSGGIWEGRQLDEPEAKRLAAFCRRLADDEAPVIALLDFPRRDRCERARQAGAATVLGKPWINENLIAALQDAFAFRAKSLFERTVARAA